MDKHIFHPDYFEVKRVSNMQQYHIFHNKHRIALFSNMRDVCDFLKFMTGAS